MVAVTTAETTLAMSAAAAASATPAPATPIPSLSGTEEAAPVPETVAPGPHATPSETRPTVATEAQAPVPTEASNLEEIAAPASLGLEASGYAVHRRVGGFMRRSQGRGVPDYSGVLF